ncbi:MAG: hypothetical protein ABIU77_26525 [Ferruginibacter sp.]
MMRLFLTKMQVLNKLLKNGKLISYPGFPHGMPTTEAATINADIWLLLNHNLSI